MIRSFICWMRQVCAACVLRSAENLRRSWPARLLPFFFFLFFLSRLDPLERACFNACSKDCARCVRPSRHLSNPPKPSNIDADKFSIPSKAFLCNQPLPDPRSLSSAASLHLPSPPSDSGTSTDSPSALERNEMVTCPDCTTEPGRPVLVRASMMEAHRRSRAHRRVLRRKNPRRRGGGLQLEQGQGQEQGQEQGMDSGQSSDSEKSASGDGKDTL